MTSGWPKIPPDYLNPHSFRPAKRSLSGRSRWNLPRAFVEWLWVRVMWRAERAAPSQLLGPAEGMRLFVHRFDRSWYTAWRRTPSGRHGGVPVRAATGRWYAVAELVVAVWNLARALASAEAADEMAERVYRSARSQTREFDERP